MTKKHIPYDLYKDILKYPKYELGVFDCFTVVRDLLNNAYGITIPNYARPYSFDQQPLDLVRRISNEDFIIKRPTNAVSQLQQGDVLVFSVGSDTLNHLGVYVGNNLFVHQLYNSLPREENLSLAWARRLKEVYYHVDVDQSKLKLDIIDLMPNHLKESVYVER